MARLTLAMVFESRLIDDVYEGDYNEADICNILHGTIEGGLVGSPVDEFAMGVPVLDHFRVARFEDGSFCLFVPNHRCILVGEVTQGGLAI